MNESSQLIEEKLRQAETILNERDIDVWMIFVRESAANGDPVLSLIYDGNFTWQSALLISRHGDRVAIVGKYDDGHLRDAGVWTEVVPYVRSIQEPLCEVLTRLDPASIAVNYSLDDYVADGLTHGMWMLLGKHLENTPYAERIVSAAEVVNDLKCRKSPTEVQRIKTAVATAEEIFAEVESFISVGRTERDISAHMLQLAAQRNVGTAWEPPCPIVNTGPESSLGHGFPSDLRVEPGHVVHIDFGVRQNEYCSDLQRCWYVPRDGESAAPEPVLKAFHRVEQAIQLAAEKVLPGVEGWQIDEVARDFIVAGGYPEYGHALGHHVGRAAHDGGGVLGPRWERYGRTPFQPVAVGHVYTIEPSIEDGGGGGGIGLEEMVLVNESGVEWLSTPQRELRCLTNT